MNHAEETCRKKYKYLTRAFAWKVALDFFINRGYYNTPYKCKICTKYHLTQKKAQLIPKKSFIKEFEDWFDLPILTNYEQYETNKLLEHYIKQRKS